MSAAIWEALEFKTRQIVRGMRAMVEEFTNVFTSIKVTGMACLSSSDEISKFEELCGFPVPLSYKTYCRIFGRGEFLDKEITIFEIPPTQHVESQLFESKSLREAQFNEPESLLQMKLRSNSFLLGRAEDVCFFWDLTSYEDDEYEIYAVTGQDNEVYNLGRGFLNFVQDFCVGNAGIERFPELIFLPEDDEGNILQTNIFSRPTRSREELYQALEVIVHE